MEDLRNIYVPHIAVTDGQGYEMAQVKYDIFQDMSDDSHDHQSLAVELTNGQTLGARKYLIMSRICSSVPTKFNTRFENAGSQALEIRK